MVRASEIETFVIRQQHWFGHLLF